MTKRLPSRQKWLLALQLLLLYLPVSLYINLPASARTLSGIGRALPFLLLISALAFGIYFVWITAIDWIQYWLTERFGANFLLEFSWPLLLLTIIISVGLAILYILVLQQLTQVVFTVIAGIWPDLLPKNTAPAISPEALLYVQRVSYGLAVVIMLAAFYITNNARAYQQLKNVQLQPNAWRKGPW